MTTVKISTSSASLPPSASTASTNINHLNQHQHCQHRRHQRRRQRSYHPFLLPLTNAALASPAAHALPPRTHPHSWFVCAVAEEARAPASASRVAARRDDARVQARQQIDAHVRARTHTPRVRVWVSFGWSRRCSTRTRMRAHPNAHAQ
eukprot:2372119-Pleurochrysis_carterae.AAC.1